MRAATRCIAAILLLFLIPEAQAAEAPARIDYRMTREHGPSSDRFVVVLGFKGTRNGTTMLKLPGRWASAEHAERGIEALEVVTPHTRLEDTDLPDLKRIVHRPGAMLTVRYVLRQIGAGEPAVDDRTPYLPVIQPGYFEWIGWTAFVTPLKEDERLHVTVAFTNLPDDWRFASSFGLDPRRVVFDGPMDRFRSSIFIGGDFRLRSRPALGGPVITATRGAWAMRDGAFADRIQTIVDGERTFWSDRGQPYFLVVLLPLKARPGWRSSTGTGLTNSFAAFISEGTELADLDALWTHEYFHNWNSPALGRFPDPEADLYWFSEGFTEYYTSLLQLRWGMLTLEQYAEVYDEKLKSLAESPYHALPNRDIAAAFFTNRSIGQLPYLRGQLLAAQWDAGIRAASQGRRSLDDLMRALRDEHLHGAAILDARRIIDRAMAEGIADPASDVEHRIDRGEMPPLKDGTLTTCITLGEITEPRFDWGFDFEASMADGKIAGLEIDGPAYAAGMRETQILHSAVSGKRTDRPVEVGIQDAGQDEIRLLHYLPVGAPLTRQSAAIRQDLGADERAACLRALGAALPSAP